MAWTRHDFNANVTMQDLVDSYMPAFQSCVEKGRVSGLMCSCERSSTASPVNPPPPRCILAMPLCTLTLPVCPHRMVMSYSSLSTVYR